MEPNDDYTSAQPITVDSTTDINGTIRAATIDRDIYDLGPVSVGDRIACVIKSVEPCWSYDIYRSRERPAVSPSPGSSTDCPPAGC